MFGAGKTLRELLRASEEDETGGGTGAKDEARMTTSRQRAAEQTIKAYKVMDLTGRKDTVQFHDRHTFDSMNESALELKRPKIQRLKSKIDKMKSVCSERNHSF